MHGPTRIFWANLTPFSLESTEGVEARERVMMDAARAMYDFFLFTNPQAKL